MKNPDNDLSRILSTLRCAESDDEVTELGRTELARLLFHHAPKVLDKVLKIARRDNRMRNCLAAARYYTGQSNDTCARIDAFLAAPFLAAAGPRAKPRARNRR